MLSLPKKLYSIHINEIKRHPFEESAPPQMPFICSMLWMAPPAGGVWGSRTSFQRTQQMAKLCFSTLSTINLIMTYFPLNYIDRVIPSSLYIFLSMLQQTNCEILFLFLFVFVLFGKSLLPCWCSYENCLEGLEWFIAYGKFAWFLTGSVWKLFII